MGHTNSTAKYKLPLFVGSDKPSWMGDFNSAMTGIDKAVQTVDNVSQQASTDATAAKQIADSALDVAVAAQDATDVNAQEITAIKAGGIKPVTLQPETVGPQMTEPKFIAKRIGSFMAITAQAKLRDPSDPFGGSYQNSIRIADFLANPAFTFTSTSTRGICGNAALYIDGGTQDIAVQPIQYKFKLVGDVPTYEFEILDPGKRLKTILRDATKVIVYATIVLPEISNIPEV